GSYTINSITRATGLTAAAGNATTGSGKTATAIANDRFTNTTSGSLTVVYDVSPVSASGCIGNPVKITLKVDPAPSFSVANNKSTLCDGEKTDLVVSSNTTNAIIELVSVDYASGNVDGTLNGGETFVSGNKITETLINLTDAIQTVTYTFRATANGCGPTADQVLTVEVRPTPEFAITNAAGTICDDESVDITLNTPTENGIITLVAVNYGVATGTLTAGTTYSDGAQVTEALSNNTDAPVTVTYTFEVSGNNCVTSQKSTSVVVNPSPTFAVANNAASICDGAKTDLSFTSPTTNAVIELVSVDYASGNVDGTLTGGETFVSGDKINEVLRNFTNTDQVVTYTFRATANGCGPTANITRNVTVRPVPEIITVSSDLKEIICSGETLNFTATSNVTGTTYTWTSVVSSPTLTGVSASGTGTITDTPVSSDNVPQTITYTITPTANGCTGPSKDYVVSVNPTPSASGTDQTICSGETVEVVINASPQNVAGTTFTWTAIPSANVAGATDGSGTLISQTLSTTDANVGTVTYRITPTANNCDGPTTDIVVTVNPVATVDAGADFQVCEPTSFTVSGLIGGAATSGTWTIINGNGSVSTSSSSGATVSATYTVDAADIDNTVTLRLTTNDPDNVGGPCTEVFDDLTISVNRQAIVTAPADYFVCEPENIELTGTIGGGATSGAWSVINGNGSLTVSSITGSTITATYKPDTSDINNTLTFRLSTNDPDADNGPCTVEYEDINITVNEAPQVSAGADFAVCEDGTIQLNGSYSGSTNSIVWSGGTGTFDNVNDTTTIYRHTQTDIDNGFVMLTITTDDPDGSGAGGPCLSISDEVRVIINKLPEVFIFNLKDAYQEDDEPVVLDGIPTGGTFTGPGIQAGTNIFDPSKAELDSNKIVYTYTDPSTGCTNSTYKLTYIRELTDVDFGLYNPIRPDVPDFLGAPIEVCQNSGKVRLDGNPDHTSGQGGSFAVLSGSEELKIEIDGNGNYLMVTDGLTSDSYYIRYTYTNSQSAVSSIIKEIKVLQTPTTELLVTNFCVVDTIGFVSLSKIDTVAAFPDSIKNYTWFFGKGDPRTTTDSTTTYVYDDSDIGDIRVKLQATTYKGCVSEDIDTIKIGAPPLVDFRWSNICNSDTTIFTNDTQVQDGVGSIVQYTWNFADGDTLINNGYSVNDLVPEGTHNNRTEGTFKNPKHIFPDNNTYRVELSALTSEGCMASNDKNVFILPVSTEDNFPYVQSFESNDGGWVAAEIQESSVINNVYESVVVSDPVWRWEVPNGNFIDSASHGDKAWWTGKKSPFDAYNVNLQTVIEGPCINILQLDRPMISLDYWSNSTQGTDGAVVQYSVDGGFEWKVLGGQLNYKVGEDGLNWYTETSLISKPGRQDLGFGWSGRSDGWKTARFSLDEIKNEYTRLEQLEPERVQIPRIRIAFGSDNNQEGAFTDKGDTLDGFAIDNIFIGEKQRTVLVEHFTDHGLTASRDADKNITAVYNAQMEIKDTVDFISLQYHINYTGNDTLHNDNIEDVNARVQHYGIEQPPVTILDGILRQTLTAKKADQLSLKNPIFKINIDTAAGAVPDENILNFAIVIEKVSVQDSRYSMFDDPDFEGRFAVQAAVIEESIETSSGEIFYNVMKKLVLPTDKRINWQKDQTSVTIDAHWEIKDVPIYDPSKLAIVVFIYDPETKEIYNVGYSKAPAKTGGPITAVDEELLNAIANIQMYPNPASRELNIAVGTYFEGKPLDYDIVDLKGVTVVNGRIRSGEERADVSRLANGIYYVVISSEGSTIMYKKIMVVNRE
ncbi:MAG: PKD-like domain-containing protein, partial [Candidatus Cyclobacteriaceae bacterium M2_1C_046]